MWVSRIDQIIQRRLDRKGIVFTVSYERAKYLMSWSRFKDIMVTHSTRDVADVVRDFKDAPAPIVLISPVVTTGWDFPMQEKPYYLVAAKVPYPDTSDLVTKARHEDDKEWSSYIAMETLVQLSGRASRSEKDKSEVIITDDNAKWFLRRYGHFAPAWFRARYRGSRNTVPNPLV
jgi:Rad3-related DNA helicase